MMKGANVENNWLMKFYVKKIKHNKSKAFRTMKIYKLKI